MHRPGKRLRLPDPLCFPLGRAIGRLPAASRPPRDRVQPGNSVASRAHKSRRLFEGEWPGMTWRMGSSFGFKGTPALFVAPGHHRRLGVRKCPILISRAAFQECRGLSPTEELFLVRGRVPHPEVLRPFPNEWPFLPSTRDRNRMRSCRKYGSVLVHPRNPIPYYHSRLPKVICTFDKSVLAWIPTQGKRGEPTALGTNNQ